MGPTFWSILIHLAISCTRWIRGFGEIPIDWLVLKGPAGLVQGMPSKLDKIRVS